MAKITQFTTTASAPRWAGSYGHRDVLLSGGAKLDAAQFSAGSDGKKLVPSGTLVGKTFAEASYGPADVADDQFAFVWLDVVDAATNNDVELYVRGEVRLNRLPAQPAANILAIIKRVFVITEGR